MNIVQFYREHINKIIKNQRCYESDCGNCKYLVDIFCVNKNSKHYDKYVTTKKYARCDYYKKCKFYKLENKNK